MFAAAIIVFRESLEAALIISVMAAATRGIPLRSRWIVGGVLAGVFGATLVGSSMDL
jgi:high-affinity iron transporter